MNTNTNSQTTPPGYWFGVIEHELRHRMRDGLSGFDLRRGSWRILNTIADGATSVDDIETALPPRRGGAGRRGHGMRGGRPFGRGFGRGDGFGGRPRFSSDDERAAFWEQRRQRYEEMRASHGYGRGEHPQHPGHHDHPEQFGRPEHFGHGDCAGHEHGHNEHHDQHDHNGHPHHHHDGHQTDARRDHRHHHPRTSRVEATIADFAERGWVSVSGDRNELVELTDAGREAHASALARIQGVRESMTADISDTDYATTIATLEAMARNLGWRTPSTPAE